MDIKPYQQRVVGEKKEVDARLTKLEVFISGKDFNTVDIDEKIRLTTQADIMRRYSGILSARIKAFYTKGEGKTG